MTASDYLKSILLSLKALEKESLNQKVFTVHSEIRLQIIDELEGLYALNKTDDRLSKTTQHLLSLARSESPWTAQTVAALLAPLERHFGKAPKDDEILSQDRSMDPIDLVRTTFPIRWILHNIRSAFNVGSFFRTAEGLGVEHIYLCGYTATPNNQQVLAAALGAEALVSYSSHPSLEILLQELSSEFNLVAIETTKSAKSLTDPFEHKPTVFIFGNERFGINGEHLDLCNETRIIQMNGSKNSLNVVVAAGIASFEWIRQFQCQ